VTEQKIVFSVDGKTIRGDFQLPKPGAACVFLCHGMEGSKDGAKWQLLASGLAEAGLGSLRFNFRGCGDGDDKSEGSFEDTSLTGRVADLKAAMEAAVGWGASAESMGVIGSSMGGMVAIAANDERVKAHVLLATPVSLADLEASLPTDGDRLTMPSGQTILRAGLQDAASYDLPALVAGQDVATLILHGDADELVPLDHPLALYKVAKEPRQMKVIPGGGHSLDGEEHLAHVVELGASWMAEHLS
jgi:alpha-beta hydrolase superfamily lysophospholipase